MSRRPEIRRNSMSVKLGSEVLANSLRISGQDRISYEMYDRIEGDPNETKRNIKLGARDFSECASSGRAMDARCIFIPRVQSMLHLAVREE